MKYNHSSANMQAADIITLPWISSEQRRRREHGKFIPKLIFISYPNFFHLSWRCFCFQVRIVIHELLLLYSECILLQISI